MGPEILGPLIPIFALLIPIVAIWTKHQQKLAQMRIESTAHESAERAAQYVARVDELLSQSHLMQRDQVHPPQPGLNRLAPQRVGRLERLLFGPREVARERLGVPGGGGV